MTMKQLKKLILLSLVPVLTTGCIKEDMDDCENVAICFRYKADGDKDVLRQYMDKIDLYVFDANNRLVDQRTYNQDALNPAQEAPSFKLPQGTYSVVAVGNAYGKTQVKDINSTDLSQIYIQHPNWGTASAVDGHDHNYMGSKQITVPGSNKFLRDTLDLFSSQINVDIEIHGLPAPGEATRAGIPYKLSIEKSNAQTDFNNEINEDEKGTCYPELVYDSQTGVYHTNDLTLFRMDHNDVLSPVCCTHLLRLEDADGNTLVTGSIYNYLQQHLKSIDVTKQEAYLPISIVFTPVGVTIKVPSWYVEDVTPDWQ